jgi:hypothetical protein
MQMVLGPRGVTLLAAVLVLQSGLIAYLLLLRNPDSSLQLLPPDSPGEEPSQTPLAVPPSTTDQPSLRVHSWR